jgi:murein DD-endopeptidase MepM/ murein hydrolase activator NlpD
MISKRSTDSSTEESPASTERKTDSRNRRRIPDLTNLVVFGYLSLPGFFISDLAQLRVLALFFLFGFWPLVSSLGASRDDPPAGWIQTGDRFTVARFVLSSLALEANPYVLLQSLHQMAGQLTIYARYRFDLPDPDSYEQRTTYRLPVEGVWTVANGSSDRSSSHSWSVLGQRYAYDFVKTDDEGRTHAGDGTAREDYYCWNQPVVAPADGVVVATSDGHRDAPSTIGWLDLRQRDIRGNYVVIEHAGEEHSLLAHLREGSITVSAGDQVTSGQQVGRCGHSGNSTEPHLHFHVQDSASFYRGMGLPVAFTSVDIGEGPTEPTRQLDEVLLAAGQRVRHRTRTPSD